MQSGGVHNNYWNISGKQQDSEFLTNDCILLLVIACLVTVRNSMFSRWQVHEIHTTNQSKLNWAQAEQLWNIFLEPEGLNQPGWEGWKWLILHENDWFRSAIWWLFSVRGYSVSPLARFLFHLNKCLFLDSESLIGINKINKIKNHLTLQLQLWYVHTESLLSLTSLKLVGMSALSVIYKLSSSWTVIL